MVKKQYILPTTNISLALLGYVLLVSDMTDLKFSPWKVYVNSNVAYYLLRLTGQLIIINSNNIFNL